MAGEGVLAGEASAARALVGLVAGVDLGVALQIVLADEALAAVVALKLTVTQVGLNM